ncbi:growth-regulating factor 1 [Punica granatum]|uniref:Growth-regulating factor n=1 Tax=Punica granatum TaxID=22663 RepID=A0A218VZG7_PUNGR|nr:growth-regulating factor 1 [Punica granatum]OWM65693.1 hypothetical protein CDL15_Pgr017190 [Punica granatum]
MDGGVVGMESFSFEPGQFSAFEAKSKGFGSEPPEEQQWRATKVLRADDGLSVTKSTTPLHHGTPLMRSERMLSFASLRPEVTLLTKDAAGYGSFAGFRGPFSPSQWIELEHQALIYKYLNANIPVPSNLLIPLRRSFNPYGPSGSSAGSLHPNSLGWGSFHLGSSGSTDPDVGRCRRTDGKKWRCTREAVADQKYCDKHINRGRHRSRKPVEGQITGHAAAASGPANPKMVSVASSSSALVVGPTGGGLNNVFPPRQNEFDRMLDPRAHNLSVKSSTVSLKSDEQTAFTLLPDQEIPVEDSMQTEFGLVSSSSLINPSQTKSYVSFLDFADPDASNHQQPLHQFVDNWPKAQLDSPIITWPEDLKSDWTQLSMSIPMASSDISSSSSSPLRLSHELDPVQVGLGKSSDLLGTKSLKQSSCAPNSWGSPLGGPLGEVLINTSIGSSPTGVLQQNASFGSLSNSSSASSPIAQNTMVHESLSFCDDVFCPTIAAIPST